MFSSHALDVRTYSVEPVRGRLAGHLCRRSSGGARKGIMGGPSKKKKEAIFLFSNLNHTTWLNISDYSFLKKKIIPFHYKICSQSYRFTKLGESIGRSGSWSTADLHPAPPAGVDASRPCA
jgi:hypothetical protein